MSKKSTYGKRQAIKYKTNNGRIKQRLDVGDEGRYRAMKAQNVQNWSDRKLWREAWSDYRAWMHDLESQGLA